MDEPATHTKAPSDVSQPTAERVDMDKGRINRFPQSVHAGPEYLTDYQ